MTMDDTSEVVGTLELLQGAIAHEAYPPRRWMAAHGGIDHLPHDGVSSSFRELAQRYRAMRKRKKTELESRTRITATQ